MRISCTKLRVSHPRTVLVTRKRRARGGRAPQRCVGTNHPLPRDPPTVAYYLLATYPVETGQKNRHSSILQLTIENTKQDCCFVRWCSIVHRTIVRGAFKPFLLWLAKPIRFVHWPLFAPVSKNGDVTKHSLEARITSRRFHLVRVCGKANGAAESQHGVLGRNAHLHG